MSEKIISQKKSKNSGLIYPNFLDHKSRPNQLSFANAFKSNTQKQKFGYENNIKNYPNKNNAFNYQENIDNNRKKINLDDDEDIKEKEKEKNNPINQIQYLDNNIMNVNNNDNDNDNIDIPKNKVLHNVESFKNLEFLLPKKNSLNEKINKKFEGNRRYINQEVYDYDGNMANNEQSFANDYSDKKNNNDNIEQKEKTININKFDLEENDDNNEEKEIYNTNSYSEEDIEKFKKQEELIKKLLKYKNFQNYIKRILKRKNFGYKKKAKYKKWSVFKKGLYNIAFLDLYYRHRIPFIIMRPRLDVIKRKREKRKKEFIERQKMEQEAKVYENRIYQKNAKDIKEGENLYTSIFQNEIEKNGFIVGEDNNTVRIEKRESLFPSRDGKPKGTFTLTKIPQKTDDNTGNIRLKIAFNKAKDAARVVRRLEYSYSMRVNILLSKPIFQKNAKIIQNWYRSMKFIKVNTPKIIKIQAFVRGMMIRKAFNEVRLLYEKYLPFIKAIDEIISRRKIKIFFEKLITRYGIRILIKLAKIQNNKIIRALLRYKIRQNYIRQNYSISTKYKRKCVYTRSIYEWLTRLKIIKLQSNMKRYIMHNSEKIMLKYANKYNPKLFYFLKYGNNKYLLDKKLKKLRECVVKFKELKMRIKYKKFGINNKYDLLKFLLRKRVFNILKQCYKDSINSNDTNYQRRVKLRMLLRRMNINNNKRILKRCLNKWNLVANYLTEYRNILKSDKLLLIQTIIKYHKKFREQIFMFLMQRIHENKIKKEKAASQKVLNLYQKFNKKYDKKHINNVLLRAFKKWKRNAKIISINNSSDVINRNVRAFLARKKFKLEQMKKKMLINLIQIRNKKFKEKLRLWKFNSGKLRRHYNNFIKKTLNIIKTRKRLQCLRKNLESLERRKKKILQKYFDRFQTNTGVKKLLYINFQLCLYDENKEMIINDKYSMMKYIKDKNNLNKEELKNKTTLKAIFNFWKMKQKFSEFKRLCKHRIVAKCQADKNMLKLKLIHWNKIIKLEKVKDACIIIQRNYRKFKKK